MAWGTCERVANRDGKLYTLHASRKQVVLYSGMQKFSVFSEFSAKANVSKSEIDFYQTHKFLNKK
jgi:hypothetical protein